MTETSTSRFESKDFCAVLICPCFLQSCDSRWILFDQRQQRRTAHAPEWRQWGLDWHFSRAQGNWEERPHVHRKFNTAQLDWICKALAFIQAHAAKTLEGGILNALVFKQHHFGCVKRGHLSQNYIWPSSAPNGDRRGIPTCAEFK